MAETKQAIKQAIVAKGVAVSDADTFRSYASKISNISGGGGGGDLPVTLASIVGTVNSMFNIYTGALIDSGQFAISTDAPPFDKVSGINWPIAGVNIGSVINANHDLYINTTVGNVEVNKRDGGVTELHAMSYVTTDAGKVLKIRWKGQAVYNNLTDAETEIFEFFLFDSGDAMLHIEKVPSTVSGAKTFFGQTFTQFSAGLNLSFYRKSYSGKTIPFDIVEELYDYSKSLFLNVPKGTYTTFDEAITQFYAHCLSLTNVANDDGTFAAALRNITWQISGTDFKAITVSGNSWMSHGSSESIRFNRRDAKYIELFRQEGKVGDLTFTAIQWKGYAHYNVPSALQIWTCYFLSNGDAFIVANQINTGYFNGTFAFYDATYTISAASPIVSFYRQNVEGTSYTAVNEPYDASLSLNLVDTTVL